MEYDPTAAFRNQVVRFDFRKLDVLGLADRNCLVGSVALLYRNSWNESATLHLDGEQWMIEALETFSAKSVGTPHRRDSVEFCYSQHLRGLIRTRVQQAFSECIELRLSSTRREPGASRRCASPVKPGACSRTAECLGTETGKRHRVFWRYFA
ncbi:class I adenylate cyclase [Shigella flexneri]